MRKSDRLPYEKLVVTKKGRVYRYFDCGNAECSVAETASISGQSFQLVEMYARQMNTKKMGSAAVLKWEQRK